MIKVKIKTKSKVKKIKSGIDLVVDRSVDEAALFLLALIRVNVPVRTGQLRDSHEIEKVGWAFGGVSIGSFFFTSYWNAIYPILFSIGVVVALIAPMALLVGFEV